MSSTLGGPLGRSLLIKVISKPAPSREDVASVIELAAAKLVDVLPAQSMTFYLLDGNEIAFKHVYYSPTLSGGDPEAARAAGPATKAASASTN